MKFIQLAQKKKKKNVNEVQSYQIRTRIEF